ncbi:MAG TPA: Y-family DNA polymerase [Drouetiella sp.]
MEQFALVDCNNFYASCERVFNPKLQNKPVVILSNNDGCVVARSNEAKELGIKMGIPYFKIKPLVKQHGVNVLSSNYPLYGDMSARVMRVIGEFAPTQEVYSIDESFLHMTGMRDLDEVGREIRTRVKQWLGLPVCVGIAPSKTLAKLCNATAKSYSKLDGVLDYNSLSNDRQSRLLQTFDVGDVWGIGRKLTEKLNLLGVKTAYDLRERDPEEMSRRFSVVMKRTITELRGISCIDMENIEEARKQILSSRSFGKAVTELYELEEAVTMYTSRAAEKLRGDGSLATEVNVMVRTSPYITESYTDSATVRVPNPTDNTMTLIKCALEALHRIYKEGVVYQKAGVTLSNLIPKEGMQLSLFRSEVEDTKSERMMNVLDETNQKYGRGALFIAGEGVSKAWKIKAEFKTPSYTTSWDDLAIAHAI